MSDSTPSRAAAALTPQLSHPARLSLGNPSPAISTRDHLAFQLDHALARDAVHTPLDLTLLLEGLRARNLSSLTLASAAPDRKTYLRRPDLGRTLSPTSIEILQNWITKNLSSRPKSASFADVAERPAVPESPSISNIAIILADGLSSLALERHALPLLDATLGLLSPEPWTLTPVCLVTQGRVAIADPIGQLLRAHLTLLLIGERPGLTSPDSLGAYLTWDPRPGRTDAERNCISNIRGDAGLSYTEAALRIAHYLREAHRLQTTGIALKDSADPVLPKPRKHNLR